MRGPDLTVLAIDDQSDNLITIRALLRDALPGVRVLTASSGAAGIAMAASGDPDVILMDVVMPFMDGFEACRRLKADPVTRVVPVVFLTALRTDREHRIAALEAGGEAFLSKPIDEIELGAQVRAMAKLKAAALRRRDETTRLEAQVDARTHALERSRSELLTTLAELRQSEEKYQLLFRNAPVGYQSLDEGGHVLDVSDAWLSALGYERSEVSGRWFGDFLTSDDRRGFRERFAANTSEPGTTRGIEFHMRRKDGSELLADFTVAPTRDAAGRFVRAHCVFRDVTEQRRAEEERESLRASLAQSERLNQMGMLAASVAHEINNPLSFVLYNLQTLAEDLPRVADVLAEYEGRLGGPAGATEQDQAGSTVAPAAGRGLLDDAIARTLEAVAGTGRIAKIVRGLGRFSRVEQSDAGPMDMREALEHALTMASNQLRYIASIDKDLQVVPPVLASAGKLAQVFLNLLINAAHAIREGGDECGEIALRTWSEGDQVCAEVRDTGTGIAPDHLDQIFDPFFTTRGSGSGSGSGLGLAICHTIIAELGGAIEVSSEVGVGTRFVVRLPRASGVAAPQPPTDGVEGVSTSERGRVLVVDDEEGIQRMVVRMLRHDREVVTASSGAVARALLVEDQAFDVVCCDLMMPGISGMALHAWVRERYPDLADRFVFMSGGTFTSGASEYLASVSNMCLNKPFDPLGFEALVAERVAVARRR